jgi:hypothetical protein
MSVRLSVFAEQLAILAEELGVGSLEHPSKLAGIFLADLDLVALGVNLEKELLAAERLELWGISRPDDKRETKLLKATTSRMADTKLRST